jgi:hypothetical protein
MSKFFIGEVSQEILTCEEELKYYLKQNFRTIFSLISLLLQLDYYLNFRKVRVFFLILIILV